MIETKIRRVGDETVITLTTEMLALLDAKLGDTLYVVRDDDRALRLLAEDPAVTAALEAGETVMDENKEALQALAKY